MRIKHTLGFFSSAENDGDSLFTLRLLLLLLLLLLRLLLLLLLLRLLRLLLLCFCAVMQSRWEPNTTTHQPS